MPLYSYKAANSLGKTVRGKINAPNELELNDRLKNQNLLLLESRAVKASAFGMFSRVTNKDLIMMCVHLEQLDKAGVLLLDSLDDLRNSSDTPAFRDLMGEIYENVKGGDMLSQALAKRSDIFSDVFVGLVAAGERTGRLSEALHHLNNHIKWNEELKRKVKKALSYPIVLLVVLCAVVGVMMVKVVPELVNFLSSQGFELPWHTKALIATSGFFSKYKLFVVLVPIITIIGMTVAKRLSPAVNGLIDEMLIKMPFLGNIIKKINLARFCHFFAITFNSGIGVLDCLTTGRKVISNSAIRDSIDQVQKQVSDGSSIADAIKSNQYFPSLVMRMFKVGEDSGNIGAALENVNYFYDREVDDSVNNMIGMIQPILTIVLAFVMFWVIASVLGPLYQSFSNLEGL